jgi:glyoxylase-like metal-dependent hydrolase (beta-lactamase superfamily II)
MMITHLGITQHVDQPVVQKFTSAQGWQIFQLPLEAYPGFWVYAYLVLRDDYRVLIDTGSGFGVCNQHLEDGFQSVREMLGSGIPLADLTHVFITHGHIDHLGGLPYIRARSQAKVGVHELDLRSVINPDEQITLVARRLEDFLTDAGVSENLLGELVNLYRAIKLDYTPVSVDFTFEEVGMQVGPFAFLHVPGHCPGQVVIQLDEILFSGDHVLSEISPHQAPERLLLNTGLGHYLKSLKALEKWGTDIHLTLGGHNPPVMDLPGRLGEIREVHHQRLDQILEILAEPHTIAEVSKILFEEVYGYNVLLALEETGAHVEYLCQRGQLAIANLSELANSRDHIPILYQTLKRLNA